MIPKTYYDDNPEDRAYVRDFWTWLQDQPQDAWLLWARTANWDNANWIFEQMIERADCDIALVAWVFWGCEPSFYVTNPDRYIATSLIAKIVVNVERGFYKEHELCCDRFELAVGAHEYLKALRNMPAVAPPFRLPRSLCGPFDGRRAAIPAHYDAQTEQDLAEIFHYLNGGLPRSEDEHQRRNDRWIRTLELPRVPRDPFTAFRDLDDAAFIEAIFGKSEAYAAARADAAKSPKKKWRLFR